MGNNPVRPYQFLPGYSHFKSNEPGRVDSPGLTQFYIFTYQQGISFPVFQGK